MQEMWSLNKITDLWEEQMQTLRLLNERVGSDRIGSVHLILEKNIGMCSGANSKNIFTGKGVNGQTWFQMDILEFLRATQLKYT